MPVLDDLRAERETLVAEIEGLMNGEDFKPDDQTFVEARSKADGLDSKIRAIVEFQKSRDSANQIDALSIGVQGRKKESESRELQSHHASLGDLVVRSRVVDEYSFRGTSARVSVPFDIQTRAPLDTTTSPGSVFIPAAARFVVPNGLESSPFLDAVGRLTVTTNSLDLVVYGPISGAAVVAEGALKPEGTFTASVTPVNLQTVAVHVQVTRQLLEDGVGLRDYLDTELRRSIMRAVEGLTGTAITGGTYTGVTGATLLEGLRVAVGTVQTQGFSATTALVNPLDMAGLDLAIWTGGGLGVPTGNTGAWGLNVIPVSSIPVGTAYVGDFVTGVKLLARSSVQVFVSDSHGDTFLKNIFTILSEGRFAPVVAQPNAIAEVTVGTGLPLSGGGGGARRGGGNG